MKRLMLSLLSCTFALLAQADENQIATVLQKSPLLSEPFSDAAQVATVKAKQQVTVLQRQGGWYEVSSDSQTGWLRMSRIRFGNGEKARPNGEGLAQTLRFLSTGRSGAGDVTVATGIRGLDAADVSNARPDHNAVTQLDQYRVAPQESRQFAEAANLQSQQLRYFKGK